MTASRIEPQRVSPLASVRVQANWLGVDISEANGGVFDAPVQWMGQLCFFHWQFRFLNLTSSGTVGMLQLKVPELGGMFPDQYPGEFTTNATVYTSWPAHWSDSLTQFSNSINLANNRATSLRGHFLTELTNY